MWHSQFIRHNLVQMLPMRQTYIFMQQQAVDDGQDTVHPVNGKQYYIGQIIRFQY